MYAKAIMQFNLAIIHNIILILIVFSGCLYPWSPKDPMRAKAIMQYNLVTPS